MTAVVYIRVPLGKVLIQRVRCNEECSDIIDKAVLEADGPGYSLPLHDGERIQITEAK